MDYKTYENKISSMLDKIGNNDSDKILDDVAVLLTDNQEMNKQIENKDKELESLKNSYEKLQKVNANLLMQIPAVQENKVSDDSKKEVKIISFRDCFDEKGNFRR